jgi:hypothetical protein
VPSEVLFAVYEAKRNASVPLAAYAILTLSSVAAPFHARGALFGIAAAMLLLLFIGIHNAWDSVAWHVFVNLRREDSERRQ